MKYNVYFETGYNFTRSGYLKEDGGISFEVK